MVERVNWMVSAIIGVCARRDLLVQAVKMTLMNVLCTVRVSMDPNALMQRDPIGAYCGVFRR
ncbi:unnamed protein product [Soboliphyme baturini]|uniref:Integrase catalytic domain-containing protein n=1 Tax=Soboliphyme baturini TaxID=241478 RepID=A0A183J9D7_9BILA|nr:unnamed protein product [Soboliphyme baturini]